MSLAATMLALALGAASLASAQTTTNAPVQPDYSAFKIIAERNIFNPHRNARAPRSDSRENRRAASVDYFSLVGTMSYEKGRFAFFDGPKSDYRKVVRAADTIAGYRVTAIEPNFVKLDSGTNQLELSVGMQLRKDEGGEWRLTSAPESSAAGPTASRATGSGRPTVVAQNPPTPSSATDEGQTNLLGADASSAASELSSESGATNASPAAADTGENDPVLRRLIERRNQELNR